MGNKSAPAGRRAGGRHARVFLSYLPEDAAVGAVVIRELRRRHVRCWSAPAPGSFSGGELPADIARELASSDCLIRICSAATRQAPLMQKELATFHALQVRDAQDGATGRRALIELIADPAYVYDVSYEAAQEAAQGAALAPSARTVTITIANRPASAWMIGILNALGTPHTRWEPTQGQILAAVIVGITLFMAATIWMSVNYVAHYGPLILSPR